MALDESRDTDDTFEVEGYKYVVDKKFMKDASPISIDFTGMGFRLSSKIELESGCSSCGTTGSCCS